MMERTKLGARPVTSAANHPSTTHTAAATLTNRTTTASGMERIPRIKTVHRRCLARSGKIVRSGSGSTGGGRFRVRGIRRTRPVVRGSATAPSVARGRRRVRRVRPMRRVRQMAVRTRARPVGTVSVACRGRWKIAPALAVFRGRLALVLAHGATSLIDPPMKTRNGDRSRTVDVRPDFHLNREVASSVVREAPRSGDGTIPLPGAGPRGRGDEVAPREDRCGVVNGAAGLEQRGQKCQRGRALSG